MKPERERQGRHETKSRHRKHKNMKNYVVAPADCRERETLQFNRMQFCWQQPSSAHTTETNAVYCQMNYFMRKFIAFREPHSFAPPSPSWYIEFHQSFLFRCNKRNRSRSNDINSPKECSFGGCGGGDGGNVSRSNELCEPMSANTNCQIEIGAVRARKKHLYNSTSCLFVNILSFWPQKLKFHNERGPSNVSVVQSLSLFQALESISANIQHKHLSNIVGQTNK